MGMFDTIYSGYNLGPGFNHCELQTKDLECSMMEFWLCPSGNLYEIDYSGTADFVELFPGDNGYDDTRLWTNFRWRSNGNHGRIKPYPITCYAEVYPSKWECHYAPYPRVFLHFIEGKLNDILPNERLSKW